MTTTTYNIPLIIRGEIIEENLVRFDGRRQETSFLTPDVGKYMDRLVLSDPALMSDMYAISMDEILDYLDELGQRLLLSRNPHIRLALEINARTSGQSREILQTAYDSIANNIRRSVVEEAMERNIGREVLDGWQERPLRDRQAWVRAFGVRMVNINAGNAPNVAMFGVINGAVLRCDSIVKSPSNDPYTATAIALTMIDMAPDHPLTKHMSVCYWKGGDQAIEKQLYNPSNIDKIVAWGGPASMNHIRHHLQPGIDLIALDPKNSISIIGPEVFADEDTMREVAGSLARDFGYFNQEGCANSRMAFVVCGTDDLALQRLNRFGEAVNSALQSLPPAVSSPHPAFDPLLRDEIDGIRYSDDFRIFGMVGNSGGVIVSQDSEPVDFRDRLGCRVMNIVPVPTIDEIINHVNVHTQSIGFFPEPLKHQVRDKCMIRGAQRLSNLGCIAYEGLAYPHDAMEMMRRIVRWGVVESFDAETAKAGTGIMCSMAV